MWALRDRPDSRHPAPVVQLPERPDRHFLQAEHGGAIGARKPDHLLEERLPPGRLRVPVEEVPGPDKQAFYCTADARRHLGPARLHAGLRPRARRRARPPRRSTSSSSRPGSASATRRRRSATAAASPSIPLSSRLFRRSRLRIPLKVAEHLPGTAALLLRRPDVLHLQWLAAPELDRVLLRPRVPTVFTAHDLLPRRTAGKQDLWRDLLARFDRVVVHSERGRESLADLGVDATVIPHPVFPSDPARADDGRTLLVSARSGRTRESAMRSRRRSRSPERACSLPAIRSNR